MGKSRDVRATLARMCCILAFAMAPHTQGTPAVGMGHFVGHRRAVASQKGAISFRRHPDFVFRGFSKILLPSQQYEDICCPAKMVHLSTHIRAIFAPHSKVRSLTGRSQRVHRRPYRLHGHCAAHSPRHKPWHRRVDSAALGQERPSNVATRKAIKQLDHVTTYSCDSCDSQSVLCGPLLLLSP